MTRIMHERSPNVVLVHGVCIWPSATTEELCDNTHDALRCALSCLGNPDCCALRAHMLHIQLGLAEVVLDDSLPWLNR